VPGGVVGDMEVEGSNEEETDDAGASALFRSFSKGIPSLLKDIWRTISRAVALSYGLFERNENS
jgi:hypothetical protein